ncbi:MAG TPA: hypothetical protein PKD37_03495 [Oligoflexia bacterium]|nr:hypothetical protein [Oligoflexia bacterium]HMP27034.1 hypothetical protein [Oligoflexia bacterium]
MNEQNPEERLGQIELILSKIAERNLKVELEKAWETSKTRIFSVVLLTYGLMCLTFWTIGAEKYFINAIIPTLGYFLSTQSLPVIKKRWLKRYHKSSRISD